MKLIKIPFKIIGILLLVFIALFLVFLLILYGDSNYNSYRIESVSMREISIDDSVLAGKRLYLFKVGLKPIKRHGIWIGGLPPFGDGSVDSIKSINVETQTGINLNSKFESIKEYVCDSTFFDLNDFRPPITNLIGKQDTLYQVFCSKDIEDEMEILQRGSMEFGFRQAYFLFVYNDSLLQPKRVIISLKDRNIKGEIEFPALMFTEMGQ